MHIIDRLRQLNLATPIAIIGAGATGLSFAKILAQAGLSATIFDEKISELKEVEIDSEIGGEKSNVIKKVAFPLSTGEFSSNSFKGYKTLLVSPGIDSRRECFADCFADNSAESFVDNSVAETANNAPELISDIELFARLTKRPVIGITGSNGKTTVASLLHSVCVAFCQKNSNIKPADNGYILCGNVGLPVLSALLLHDDNVLGYIVELSSYQLENCPSLQLELGALLNLSEDHLDRYDSYAHYMQAKANVLRYAKTAIINLDDEQVVRLAKGHPHCLGFSTHASIDYPADCYLVKTQTAIYLRDIAINEFLVSQQQIKLVGTHNLENIMAVALLARQIGVDIATIVKACKEFEPIANRYVNLGLVNGVRFINDSKATNVGATIKALLSSQQKVVLIAGGLGKGQDFSLLRAAVKSQVRALVLIGKDANNIADALAQLVPTSFASDLADALQKAISYAQQGDAVLLSPACASFDMFANYAQRGQMFEAEVKKLANITNVDVSDITNIDSTIISNDRVSNG